MKEKREMLGAGESDLLYKDSELPFWTGNCDSNIKAMCYNVRTKEEIKIDGNITLGDIEDGK